MKTEYNILWVDDQHDDEEMVQFIVYAENEGIILEGFASFEEAFEKLEDKLEEFDAILLDGMFFEKKDQLTGTEDEVGIGMAIAKINELKSKKVFPWFVLSGKDQFTKSKNSIIAANKKRCFDKTNPKDVVELFQLIKIEVTQQPDFQIRHEYQKVFDVCTDKYIGEAAKKPLLQILKSIKNPLNSFEDELYFTQIRIILESMFRAANKLGLLHDKCLERGKVNLSDSSLFLSGEQTKHLDVSCKRRHFNKIISDSVKSLLFITGAASHTIDPEIKNNINLEEYRKTINTPYLLYSLTFQLTDILIWFKKYADENPDKEKNKSLWVNLEEAIGDWQEGIVISLSTTKGFAFFKPTCGTSNAYIHPTIVSDNALAENDHVTAIIEEFEDNRTKEIKKKVKEIKKI